MHYLFTRFYIPKIVGLPVFVAHAHSIKRMTLGMSTLETKLSTSFENKRFIFSKLDLVGLTMTDE